MAAAIAGLVCILLSVGLSLGVYYGNFTYSLYFKSIKAQISILIYMLCV
jgi:hypothetical protein